MFYTNRRLKSSLLLRIAGIGILWSSRCAAVTTSWKGTISTSWSTSGNWTNGAPSSTKDIIIGDANFTGSFQPVISNNETVNDLTIGNGSIAVTLTMIDKLTVNGSVMIGANGTLAFNCTSASNPLTVSGNFTNNGYFNTVSNNPSFILDGASQSISGTSSTTFRRFTINSGSTVMLNQNISVTYSLINSGTLDTNEPTYLVNITGSIFTLNAGSVSYIKASTFSGNYSIVPSSVSPTATIDYAATTTNQTVSSVITYGILTISGAMTKSLSSNLPDLQSSASGGKLNVNGGTLNLNSYTASRSSNGGTFTVANGATLKIGGTNSFPSNYSTKTLGTTSTIEYAGTAQTILAITYGHLIISGSGNKTAAAALTIAGNFTLAAGTFAGGNYTHNIQGNWINTGATFTNTNTVINFNGTSAQTITSNGISFYQMTINNSTGVSLTDNCTVANLLTLTAGMVTTGSYKIIITNSAASSLTNYSSTSYINGILRRYIANNTSTYGFPVGTATTYHLTVLINKNLAGITYIDASFGAKPGNDNGLSVFESGTYYTTVNSTGVWYLTPNASPSSGAYDLQCYLAGFSGLADNSFSILSRVDASSDASDWGKAGGTLNANGGLGRKVSDGYALRLNLTSFSQKGIGQSGMPLPVTLSAFEANKVDDNIQLHWVTSAEMNTDKFEIERAVDNSLFEKIGELKAAGTSLSELSYDFTDFNVDQSGTRYYRLKIIDIDQSFSYSSVIAVIFSKTASDELIVFPNPSTGVFELKTNFKYTHIEVYNIQGDLLFSAAEIPPSIELKNQPRGVYFLIARNEMEQQVIKLTVH